MSRMTILCCVTAVITLASSGTARAGDPEYPPMAQIVYQGESQLMHAQAALMNAQAGIIQAIAAANTANANTASILENNRATIMENNSKACQTYYARRQARDTYATMRAEPARTRNVEAQPASATRRSRLTTKQFDAVRGEIQWPAILNKEAYSPFRTQVDELFAARAAGNNVANFQDQVTVALDKLERALRADIRKCTPSEYMAAKRFLQGLAAEAEYAPPVAVAYNP